LEGTGWKGGFLGDFGNENHRKSGKLTYWGSPKGGRAGGKNCPQKNRAGKARALWDRGGLIKLKRRARKTRRGKFAQGMRMRKIVQDQRTSKRETTEKTRSRRTERQNFSSWAFSSEKGKAWQARGETVRGGGGREKRPLSRYSCLVYCTVVKNVLWGRGKEEKRRGPIGKDAKRVRA